MVPSECIPCSRSVNGVTARPLDGLTVSDLERAARYAAVAEVPEAGRAPLAQQGHSQQPLHRHRSMSYLEGECSYSRVEEEEEDEDDEEEEEIQRRSRACSE